jgi:hypothetical protein
MMPSGNATDHRQASINDNPAMREQLLRVLNRATMVNALRRSGSVYQSLALLAAALSCGMTETYEGLPTEMV